MLKKLALKTHYEWLHIKTVILMMQCWNETSDLKWDNMNQEMLLFVINCQNVCHIAHVTVNDLHLRDGMPCCECFGSFLLALFHISTSLKALPEFHRCEAVSICQYITPKDWQVSHSEKCQYLQKLISLKIWNEAMRKDLTTLNIKSYDNWTLWYQGYWL